MPEIHRWPRISRKFIGGPINNKRAALILGNGSSIAIDSCFAYSSLLREARRRALITENVESIFDHLSTEDFELVLRMLWHATYINQSLGIHESRTVRTYSDLQRALIETIRQIHSPYDDASNRLLTIAGFMKKFSTVLSLNYDFIVYWAMLAANSEWNVTWFKDCFTLEGGGFDYAWQRYREPFGRAEGATLVFYPHGNLALAIDQHGEEIKLARDEYESGNLLETVIDKWESDSYTPLFVSEGTSRQKLRAIHRSNYLDTVYKSVLPRLGSKLAIFGWSMSRNDEHILKAIGKGKLTDVAVSVLTTDRDLRTRCDEIEDKIRRVANNEDINILFFDANSAGCWANP